MPHGGCENRQSRPRSCRVFSRSGRRVENVTATPYVVYRQAPVPADGTGPIGTAGLREHQGLWSEGPSPGSRPGMADHAPTGWVVAGVPVWLSSRGGAVQGHTVGNSSDRDRGISMIVNTSTLSAHVPVRGRRHPTTASGNTPQAIQVTEGPALPTVASNQPRYSHTRATHQGKGGARCAAPGFSRLWRLDVLEAEGVIYGALFLRFRASCLVSCSSGSPAGAGSTRAASPRRSRPQ